MIKVLHVPGGLLFLVGFGLLLPISTTSSVCNLTLIGANDSVLTLSNDQVNADTADRECVKLGGHLATTTDQQINDSLTTEINQKNELQRIYIFRNLTTNVYKYSKDPAETGSWKSTKNNANENLWFIDLYKRWAIGRVKVTFCTDGDQRKWLVALGQTGESCGPLSDAWFYDFHLYGSPSAAGSAKIYSYISYPSRGSRLTTVQGNYHNNFDKDEISFFSPDLQRVYMFYNPTDVRFYKYSTNPNETGVWKSTKNNPNETLWFIDLHRTLATGRVKVTFCTPSARHKWLVAVGQTGNYCGPNSNNWFYDFHLYGSSSATGSQQIYSYRRYDSGSYSSRLTTVQGNYYNNFDKYEISFFSSVPVKVLIGARYNNSRWLWSDGTPANFAAPTSPSTCLQKAYDSTLNTWEDVQCTQTAYYACQVKFSAIIEQPKCKSNYLIVKWNDNLSKLAAATGNNINTVSLNVHSKEMSVSVNVPYKTSVAQINGLKAQTSYLTTVQIKFSGCNNFTLTNTMTTTTGYGLPDQVTTARAVNSEPCILAISQITNHRNITSYTVTATSNTKVAEHNFNNTFKSVEDFRIPLTGHPEKQRINFTIHANSCEGSGKKSSVSEFCVSPESSTTNTKFVGIIVGSSVGVLLLLILIVVAVMTKKRMAESTTVQEPATPQSRVVYLNQTANAQDNEGEYVVPQGMQVYEVVQNPKRV